tara:strand:+ start:6341 stop:6697 length:357 start_codon:yes stop_codon:yes gene_type:complete
MKKGKITHISPRGEYTNASGTFNKYQVRFDDGNEFQFLAKGEFKKTIGTEVFYTITSEQYKTARLEYKPQASTPPNKDQLIIRQSMVKAACDFNANRPQSDAHTVLADAQLFIDFINK